MYLKPIHSALIRYTTGLGSLFLAVGSIAQGIDGGALLRQQQPLTDRPAFPSVPETVMPKADEKPRPSSGKTIHVKGYRLSMQLNILSDEQANELLSGFRDREMTFEEIQQAAELVGKQIRDKGYAVARVYIPAQEIRDGIVTIVVMIGKLALKGKELAISLRMDPSLRLNPDFAQAVLGAAISNREALKLEQIERGMLLLNDLPGIQSASAIIPGSEPGTVGLAVQITEGPVVQGGLSVDTHGVRTTGEVRSGASLDINDPSGRGDALKLRFVTSIGMKNLRSSYVIPLGVSGLKATISGSVLTYKQGKELSVLDFHGATKGASLGLSYPILLTRRRSVFGTVQFETREIKDIASGGKISHKRATSISAGLQESVLLEAWSAISSFGANLMTGELDKSRVAADLQQDMATQRAQGHYAVLRLNAAYVQNLTPRFSLYTNLFGQIANKNLDSSEKLYLGGPHGVRAYSVEEAGGDDGGLLSIEGRWQPWTASGDTDVALIGFFDAGRIRRNHFLWNGWNIGNPGMQNTHTLKGMGLGVSLVTQQRGKVELLYARRIGSNPGRTAAGLDANGRSDRNRMWLTASLFF